VVFSLLFEHKSDLPEQPIFFVQLLQYLPGIWQKDLSEGRPLTFVVPAIVYHGRRQWDTRSFWSCFEGLAPVFEQYLPEFRYAFTDLSLIPIPDQIIRTKDSLSALRSVYLAFKERARNNIPILAAFFSALAALLVGYVAPLCALLAPCRTKKRLPKIDRLFRARS
jgi:hypothetical protein